MMMLKQITSFIGRINRKVDNFITVSRLLPRSEISHVILFNRETLKKVNQWIDEETYKNSVFHYGLPLSSKELIDREINSQITYTDAILYLSRFLKKPVNYLELGVSVGKNFFQAASFLENSVMIGFDIEEINPTLEQFFKKRYDYIEWDTMANSLKTGKSSLIEYDYHHNQIYYLSGDIFDDNSWKQLSGRKFNIIFSDAFHDPKALIHEYNMIKKYDLLDQEEFIMIWDDLGGEMTESFKMICQELSCHYHQNNLNNTTILLNGWLGSHEHKHQIGIVTYFAHK